MTSLVQANVTIQGSITSLGTLGQTTFAPVDLGVNSLSLATGNLTSLITTTASAPAGFAAVGEGSLVFPGTANAYISFGTTGQPFSNSNIYAFGDFVVEAWVNPANFTTANFIVNFGDAASSLYWYLATGTTTGQLVWYSLLNGASSSAASTASLTTGTWQHIAVIHQSSTKRIQLYINGQPQTFTAASSGGFTMAGTVATYTTGVIPVTGQQLVVGQAGGGAMTGSLTNLRIVTGSGAAQIYNNNAFTPSTTPLFPASNTAGGSLTTRLLVRVPLAPNKMVVPKLGGANCNTVLAFPPAPMTSYATNMTGQSYYGQGTYVASASFENTGALGYAYNPFDKSSSTFWHSQTNYNNTITNSGTYTGSVVTIDANGTSYSGEWLQIQKPSSIVISNYSIMPRSGVEGAREPRTFWILGSRDGITWFLVDSRGGVNTWVSPQVVKTFTVTSAQAFTYFRMVIYQVGNASSGTTAQDSCQIAEWTLNGQIEGPTVSADGRLGVGVSAPVQALEVAGSAVVAGTLSAGNPLMFRNRIINGDMRVAQRGTSFTGVTNSGGNGGTRNYSLDRFSLNTSGGETGGSLTYAQTTDVPQGQGFANALSVTVTAAFGNIGWYFPIFQAIEGININDLMWGTSYGQPITVSFWWKSSLTGNFCLTLKGGGYCYNASYTYSTAASWQYFTITVPPPPNGATFFPSADNLFVGFAAYWVNNTSGVWVAGNSWGVTGGVNFLVNNGAYIRLTGVQLEKGSVATPFEVRPYGVELALCQRYYEKSYNVDVAPGTNTAEGSVLTSGSSDGYSLIYSTIKYAVPKRIAVTPTFYLKTGAVGSWTYSRSGVGETTVTAAVQSAGASSFVAQAGIGAMWVVGYTFGHWVASAEL
jgi:hypothetical protein